jgi:ribosomal protein L7/L12
MQPFIEIEIRKGVIKKYPLPAWQVAEILADITVNIETNMFESTYGRKRGFKICFIQVLQKSFGLSLAEAKTLLDKAEDENRERKLTNTLEQKCEKTNE